MTLQCLVPPVGEPVSLAEAKAVLRVTDGAEDALISRLIRAARQRIEMALSLSMTATTWRETFDQWSDRCESSGIIRLRMGPLLSVIAVRVADGSGTLQTLSSALYQARQTSRPALIWPVGGRLFEAGVASGGLQIDYRCGYGEAAADVPEPLRQAILALVAHGFEHREAAQAPLGLVEPWLAPFRRARL
jgi:uncharacterized phiE125 gp8 family phage protein